MPTIQEVVDRRRILEEAKQGMRREKFQQVKQQSQKVIKNIRTANYKKTSTTPKSKGQIPTKKVQSAFLKMFAGVQPKTSKGSLSVGRPRNVFKHISPITGKPIPAQIYNKEMRFIRRRQQDIATQKQLQIQQQLANRGITPQQAQQIELMRQLQTRQVQMQSRQMPTQQVISLPTPSQTQIQTQEMPQAGRIIPSTNPSIWNRRTPVLRGLTENWWA